ncbi:MAG: class I SAM-dependent methyltransferase [Magnetococcales bacterium]|nr:class I SAM-dependent methyltransferase [Magnetococcales bacterium]
MRNHQQKVRTAMGYGKGVPLIFPGLTYQCNPKAEGFVKGFPADARLLDLGAGGRRIAGNVITIDFVRHAQTDLIADVCRVPLADHSVDGIIATGLFEHVENDIELIVEIHRLLKKNGKVHIEVPFMQQYHEDPIDYRRYTIPGLEQFVRRHGFQVIDSGFHIGPTVTWLTISSYYFGMLFEGKTILAKILSNAIFMLVSLVGYPLKHLDKFLHHKKSAHRLAFGVYCTAQVSES